MNDFLVKYLNNIIDVPFTLKSNNKETKIGTGKSEFTVALNGEISKKELLISTSLALGEAYMDKKLELNRSLYEVLDLFIGNTNKFISDRKSLKKLIFTSLSRKNQKEEVSSHYDIGNDFYKLWLDDSMSYSCGYFQSENDTLYQAQINKVNHILDKLCIEKGMSLLDIGCGWGFLLRQAAKRGIKGYGITLSMEQYNKFKADIKNEGLENVIDVEIMDYRDLKKSNLSFDRIVSVGMIEHVGRGNYEEFIECANSVIKPGGLFLLHYISALKEYPGDPWIKKYIFPGGVIPSLREIIDIISEYGFYTLDVESLRRHYNKTLLKWRDNFNKQKDKVIDMKGEKFYRMWDLYLSSCAAVFNRGVTDIHQLLMSKGVNNSLPMNRTV